MNENSDLFDGKVAVVTGASTGIGLGLSRKLLDNGSEVYMSSRTPEHITEAVESLRQYGGRVHAQVLDVRDEKAVAGYMDYVAARGQVDYLFCNAGVGFLRRQHHAPALPEHLRRVEARCLRVARALKYELEDKHIKMSVVCPGAVATNIFFRSLDTHCIPKRPCPRTRSASNRRGARSWTRSATETRSFPSTTTPGASTRPSVKEGLSTWRKPCGL